MFVFTQIRHVASEGVLCALRAAVPTSLCDVRGVFARLPTTLRGVIGSVEELVAELERHPCQFNVSKVRPNVTLVAKLAPHSTPVETRVEAEEGKEATFELEGDVTEALCRPKPPVSPGYPSSHIESSARISHSVPWFFVPYCQLQPHVPSLPSLRELRDYDASELDARCFADTEEETFVRCVALDAPLSKRLIGLCAKELRRYDPVHYTAAVEKSFPLDSSWHDIVDVQRSLSSHLSPPFAGYRAVLLFERMSSFFEVDKKLYRVRRRSEKLQFGAHSSPCPFTLRYLFSSPGVLAQAPASVFHKLPQYAKDEVNASFGSWEQFLDCHKILFQVSKDDNLCAGGNAAPGVVEAVRHVLARVLPCPNSTIGMGRLRETIARREIHIEQLRRTITNHLPQYAVYDLLHSDRAIVMRKEAPRPLNAVSEVHTESEFLNLLIWKTAPFNNTRHDTLLSLCQRFPEVARKCVYYHNLLDFLRKYPDVFRITYDNAGSCHIHCTPPAEMKAAVTSTMRIL